jgi:hypothetical protein
MSGAHIAESGAMRDIGTLAPLVGIAAVLAADGCSPERYPAVLRLSWSISNSAGASVGCGDAEAVTVRYSFSDGSGQDFYCVAGVGDVDSDAASDLTATASLLDVSGQTITQAAPVDIGRVDWADSLTVPATAFVVPDCAPGQYKAEWTIHTATGEPAACPPGANVVLNTDTAGVGVPCEAGSATSVARRGGANHTVSLRLDANGQILTQTTPASVLVPCGGTIDLGTIDLVLPP